VLQYSLEWGMFMRSQWASSTRAVYDLERTWAGRRKPRCHSSAAPPGPRAIAPSAPRRMSRPPSVITWTAFPRAGDFEATGLVHRQLITGTCSERPGKWRTPSTGAPKPAQPSATFMPAYIGEALLRGVGEARGRNPLSIQPRGGAAALRDDEPHFPEDFGPARRNRRPPSQLPLPVFCFEPPCGPDALHDVPGAAQLQPGGFLVAQASFRAPFARS